MLRVILNARVSDEFKDSDSERTREGERKIEIKRGRGRDSEREKIGFVENDACAIRCGKH